MDDNDRVRVWDDDDDEKLGMDEPDVVVGVDDGFTSFSFLFGRPRPVLCTPRRGEGVPAVLMDDTDTVRLWDDDDDEKVGTDTLTEEGELEEEVDMVVGVDKGFSSFSCSIS